MYPPPEWQRKRKTKRQRGRPIYQPPDGMRKPPPYSARLNTSAGRGGESGGGLSLRGSRRVGLSATPLLRVPRLRFLVRGRRSTPQAPRSTDPRPSSLHLRHAPWRLRTERNPRPIPPASMLRLAGAGREVAASPFGAAAVLVCRLRRYSAIHRYASSFVVGGALRRLRAPPTPPIVTPLTARYMAATHGQRLWRIIKFSSLVLGGWVVFFLAAARRLFRCLWRAPRPRPEPAPPLAAPCGGRSCLPPVGRACARGPLCCSYLVSFWAVALALALRHSAPARPLRRAVPAASRRACALRRRRGIDGCQPTQPELNG